MSAAEYDIFLSHAWTDGERPWEIVDALTKAGLRVWFDATEINDFASITRAVTEGLAKSKALLAYYSKAYPLRRACQWELTAAFLAAQNEGDPRLRVLVINPEKGSEHIHPIELRDEKYLHAPSNSAEMQALVEAVRKHGDRLNGPLAEIEPLAAPRWHGMVPVGSTRFVGRLKEMWEIHSLLHGGDVAQILGTSGAAGGIGQVHGLGGVGKSLLAEEYALHFGAAYPGGVFWLRAYGNDDAKNTLGATEREALHADQVRQLAERLGISTRDLTAQQVEGALANKIESAGRACLWVVDDVPHGLDGQALRRWFAPHPMARTLITTRSREYASLAKGIDLSVLMPEEAFQLLTSRRRPAGEDEAEQVRLLAQDLGYHALALDVTASALVSYGVAEPFGKFRGELAKDDEDALELAKDLADALPNGHETSIAKTLLRSILRLGPEGRDFLKLASILAVAPIPASLVKMAFENVDHITRWDAQWRVAQAFHQVTAASLAEIAGENGEARSVHTLISRTMRFHEKSSPERTVALRAAAVSALKVEIASAAADLKLHMQIELHVPHARHVVSIPTTVPEEILVGLVGRYDFVRGSYSSAVILFSRALEFSRRVRGSEHPLTLIAMNNLGRSLRGQGNFTGARKLDEETLALRRKVLGREHPETLTSMGNLASMLLELGDLVGARKLHEETLEIGLRLWGPEHKDALTLMNNLALVLKAQGDLKQSRTLLEHAVAGRRRVLGPEHVDTLAAMGNLAGTLFAQGNFADARTLQEKTLMIQCRELGPEHPYLLNTMNGLASSLREQGDWVGARKLQEETLEIRRRVLGPEHPETLVSMGNLATTLYLQGDFSEARRLRENVLAVHRRLLGLEHPHTLTSMGNLATTLQAQGELEEARKLQQETLEIRLRVLGSEHPGTAESMNNLSVTLDAKGDVTGARELQERALDIFRQVLGIEHSDTSNAAWNLVSILRKLQDHEAAATVLKRDLSWMLDRDPATLAERQRAIRERVARAGGS